MTSFIKKKTSDKKFYGYTGPVKPETKSKYIQKNLIKNLKIILLMAIQENQEKLRKKIRKSQD